MLVFSVIAASNYAKEVRCDSANTDCVAIGDWDFSIGIGVGVRTNPIIDNDNLPIILLPSVSYYGKRFFWETDTLGFTLFETPKHMFNIVATISYDQTYFHDLGIGNFSIEGSGNGGAAADAGNFGNIVSDENSGAADGPIAFQPEAEEGGQDSIDFDDLHDRDMSGLMGFEYSLDGESMSFGLQALQDVSSVHDGKQLRLAFSNALYQSESTTFMTNLGAEWKDSKTLDYYYGVRADEVSDSSEAYIVDDDVSYYVKFDWRKRISKHWELRAVIHNRWFGDAVYNSPLVEDKTTLAVFFGGVYHL